MKIIMEPLYRCVRKGTKLYVAERAGAWARWSGKREALVKPKQWWNENINKDILHLLMFEPAT